MVETIIILASLGAIAYYTIYFWDRIKPLLYRATKLQLFSVSFNVNLKQLKISPILHQNTWSLKKVDKNYNIIVNAYFWVSNLSDSYSNSIASIKAINHKTSCSPLLRPVINNNFSKPWDSKTSIFPNTTCELWLACSLTKKRVNNNKGIKFNFLFIDKYSNNYKIKNVIFEPKQLEKER
jgi:hypothetical protein